jgi:hypothetical protein
MRHGPVPECGPGLPSAITFTVSPTGTDFDRGWQGTFHNRAFPAGTRLTMFLRDCDTDSDPECDGIGPTGSGSVNGATFGAPFPILAVSVPVCLVSRFADDFTGTVDLETGHASAVVKLVTDAYVTGNVDEICPRCQSSGGVGSPGTCTHTGEPCTVEGELVVRPLGPNPDTYSLSSQCLPPDDLSSSSVTVELPLTTAESRLEGSTPCVADGGITPQDDDCVEGSCTSVCTDDRCVTTDDLGRCIDAEGGIAQRCCSNDTRRACFPSAPDSGGAIVRTGNAVVPAPAWPDPVYPKTASGTVLAATFCLDPTASSQTNIVTGLPGPGALLLPVTSIVTTGGVTTGAHPSPSQSSSRHAARRAPLGGRSLRRRRRASRSSTRRRSGSPAASRAAAATPPSSDTSPGYRIGTP